MCVSASFCLNLFLILSRCRFALCGCWKELKAVVREIAAEMLLFEGRRMKVAKDDQSNMQVKLAEI